MNYIPNKTPNESTAKMLKSLAWNIEQGHVKVVASTFNNLDEDVVEIILVLTGSPQIQPTEGI